MNSETIANRQSLVHNIGTERLGVAIYRPVVFSASEVCVYFRRSAGRRSCWSQFSDQFGRILSRRTLRRKLRYINRQSVCIDRPAKQPAAVDAPGLNFISTTIGYINQPESNLKLDLLAPVSAHLYSNKTRRRRILLRFKFYFCANRLALAGFAAKLNCSHSSFMARMHLYWIIYVRIDTESMNHTLNICNLLIFQRNSFKNIVLDSRQSNSIQIYSHTARTYRSKLYNQISTDPIREAAAMASAQSVARGHLVCEHHKDTTILQLKDPGAIMQSGETRRVEHRAHGPLPNQLPAHWLANLLAGNPTGEAHTVAQPPLS